MRNPGYRFEPTSLESGGYFAADYLSFLSAINRARDLPANIQRVLLRMEAEKFKFTMQQSGTQSLEKDFSDEHKSAYIWHCTECIITLHDRARPQSGCAAIFRRLSGCGVTDIFIVGHFWPLFYYVLCLS